MPKANMLKGKQFGLTSYRTVSPSQQELTANSSVHNTVSRKKKRYRKG